MKIKHLIAAKQFHSRQSLDKLFNLTEKLEKAVKQGNVPQSLKGKIVATLFFENSTRTRLSFESAIYRLGGQALSMANAAATSSASKGESLSDTIKVVAGYSDAIVIRHPENGSARIAAQVSRVPVINAGDGYNEHPTQALYDLYTIKKELGAIDNLKIAFLADFRYQRNIHSLVFLFSYLKNAELYLVSPKVLSLPNAYKSVLRKSKVKFTELPNLNPIVKDLDVLYVTRVFKERFASKSEYEKLKKSLFIGKALVAKMKKRSAILHVMPRIYEIDPAVDADPRAAYFRQAENGMYVRMAILHAIFSKLNLWH